MAITPVPSSSSSPPNVEKARSSMGKLYAWLSHHTPSALLNSLSPSQVQELDKTLEAGLQWSTQLVTESSQRLTAADKPLYKHPAVIAPAAGGLTAAAIGAGQNLIENWDHSSSFTKSLAFLCITGVVVHTVFYCLQWYLHHRQKVQVAQITPDKKGAKFVQRKLEFAQKANNAALTAIDPSTSAPLLALTHLTAEYSAEKKQLNVIPQIWRKWELAEHFAVTEPERLEAFIHETILPLIQNHCQVLQEKLCTLHGICAPPTPTTDHVIQIGREDEDTESE